MGSLQVILACAIGCVVAIVVYLLLKRPPPPKAEGTPQEPLDVSDSGDLAKLVREPPKKKREDR